MGAASSSLLVDTAVQKGKVEFLINGEQYMVDEKVSPDSVLVDFVRDKAGLKGTKFMCREGGCGACVVTVISRDPKTGVESSRAVNSCLVPVLSADGWQISTVEGLGDKKKGYHKIQEALVKFNGSQCGYCTPGMVMNCYGLMKSKPKFTMQDVEDSFDGNICRCTGYRPILDAFKSFSTDAVEELKRKAGELREELGCCSGKSCCQQIERKDKEPEEGEVETGFDVVENINVVEAEASALPKLVELASGNMWIRPTRMDALFRAIMHSTSMRLPYKVIAGNTGSGVYKNDVPDSNIPTMYIDINAVPELQSQNFTEIGSAVTISQAIAIFQKASQTDGYSYLGQISKHLKRVANTPVRNLGTIGGNLMLKHSHREFPSDIFTLLDCVGATLKIGASPILVRDYSMQQFLEVDMRGKVIISVKFPAYRGTYFFHSFKITRRYQNSHAYVNAAILMKVDPKRNFSVRDKPSIVFGGISPTFSHAAATEMYFVGKFLNLRTIKGAMSSLERELVPSISPLDGSPQYRKLLAQALLYKACVRVMGDSVGARYKGAGSEIDRYLMSGKQEFGDGDRSQWPLYQPIAKLEAKFQAAGEAEYIGDITPHFGELHGAYVLTAVGNADIKSIDASEALLIPGVVKFIQAKDIPGANNACVFYPEQEEIFASKKVRHAGQAVGMILATDRNVALKAVKRVSVTYSNVRKPILTLPDALKEAEKEGKLEQCLLTVKKSEAFSEAQATRTIKGEFQVGSQYHMHMETQTCLCVPKEDGIEVYSATQFTHGVQAGVAAALGVQANQVTVSVRRLGGGYGAKISKATQIAASCAVAANLTNRPVRVILDLETNMRMVGKRLPYLAKYEVGVDDLGKILNLNCKIFCGPGYTANEATTFFALLNLQNCYRALGWEVSPGHGITNTHPNTYCRAPGSTQAIAIIENIMEHIAFSLKLDPLQVRQVNFIQRNDEIFGIPGLTFQGENPMPDMIQNLKMVAEYEERKSFIDEFNRNNRWKKRGIALVPMRYPNFYPDLILRFPVYISVYAFDGTVNVSHSGIEMGQGINTKCAQVVAHFLGIPIDKVKVQPTTSLISPNSGITGGAITSELICHAAVQCCNQLKAKMEPVKAKLTNPTWEELVMACYKEHVLLTAHHQDKLDDVKPYDIWGATLIEVEVDVLTGEYKIVRVDLHEDAGKSLSPNVDIGQIEGAFVMGLGLWTSEKIIYDQDTGQLLTNGTWTYKVPFPRDIPEDFRVVMLKKRENPNGVLGSKATGEAPLTMTICVLFALRYAINSARQDVGNTEWYQMDGPVTPEDIQRMALTNSIQFSV